MEESEERNDELLTRGTVIPFGNGDIDLSEIAERTTEPIPIDSARLEVLLSESIPDGASIANAITQGERILVVYPPGSGWDDLMDRKTPGLEGLKHPAVKADDGGVGGGFAALERKGVSPEALFDLALHVASFAVGQANMTMIRRGLRDISASIDEVIDEIDMKNLSNLHGFESTLNGYKRSYQYKFARDDDRHDIKQQIMHIISCITNIYQNEMDIMGAVAERVSRMPSLDKDRCNAEITRFVNALQRCYYALHLEAFARRLLIDYEGDYSIENTRYHYEEVQSKSDDYVTVVEEGLSLISGTVGVSGASESTVRFLTHRYESFVGLIALPFQIKAWNEMEVRSDLGRRVSDIMVPTVAIAGAFEKSLDEPRFLHRESNAIIVSGDTIQPLLLKEGADLRSIRPLSG